LWNVDAGRNLPELLVVEYDDGHAAPDISSAAVAHGTPESLAENNE